MANLSIKVVNDSNENIKVFGNVETAIEYCSARINENFTVYINHDFEYLHMIDKIKAMLYSNLKNIRIVQ